MASDELDQLRLRLDNDSGSETLAWYTFQETLAAQVVVEMLAGLPIRRVLCESDEDYLIDWTDGRPEFVSVKHREPDQGEWTYAALCGQGGLRHLFNSWKSAEKKFRCRLQTNAGLKPGPGEARRLALACRDQDTEALDEFVSDLRGRLGADSDEQVLEFLGDLRIQDSLPKRDDLRPRLLEDLQDQMTSIGWPPERHGANFELVCSEVHKVLPTSEHTAEHPASKCLMRQRSVLRRLRRRRSTPTESSPPCGSLSLCCRRMAGRC